MKRWFVAFVALVATSSAAAGQDNILKIDIKQSVAANMPLTVPLSVPAESAKLDEVQVMLSAGAGGRIIVATAQLTAPGIVTEAIKPSKDGLVRRDLHVIVPTANIATMVVHLKPVANQQVKRFAWFEKEGEQDLVQTMSGTFTPYLRYMHRPYDASSQDARDKSYKVFHHLYDPTGKRFVTNGGHTDANAANEKLHYPHHRGIMYGFNQCSFGPDMKQKADTWHCPPKGNLAAHVAHEKTLRQETGPVLGRHRVLIGWYGAGDKPFALEERELTVYDVPGGRLVEFASRLKTTGGTVRVDGDPQHAGFQFRAANEVADKKSAAQTFYLRPDGKGEPGATRNWDPKTKQGPVDLPWYAMSFVLGDQRFTTVYLNHPSNPKETRFSERDYGRFGGYFQKDITEAAPLVVNYRLWMQAGEMTKEQAEGLQKAFVAGVAK